MTKHELIDIILTNYNFDFSSEQKQALLQYGELDAATKQVIDIVAKEVGLGKDVVAAILLRNADVDDIKKLFSESVSTIVNGYRNVEKLSQKQTSIESDNFRKLMLSLAEDIRVVIIKIAERLQQIRYFNTIYNSADEFAIVHDFAHETSVLYAPLAHRLGLYAIKTELEDLSLKILDYQTYKDIAHALNETKANRDKYIHQFIEPLEQTLTQQGFKFTIKGRTKSIHSIHNKMLKQQCTIDKIYDLFAIRIILDSEYEREKAECWQVYSIIADKYTPNTKRLRDWLTIPKSNGYESLHTTVLGPEGRWVEVQIRTRRMDEIAEKGVAAHWKYKGIKSEGGIENFLKGVRELLENNEDSINDAVNDFKLDLYDQEVFVFTPKGELFKLPKGATVLDFAFAIHTQVGCKCIGAKIDGKNVQIRQLLRNGCEVEILTSAQQKPNRSWLDIVKTSKARNKIRQALKEIEYANAAEGRELLERRLKNWKLVYEEGLVSKMAKKIGYESVSDFYQSLAQGKEDILRIRDIYQDILNQANTQANNNNSSVHSAEDFSLQQNNTSTSSSTSPLIIDGSLNNVEYRLAKCCNPVFGDDIFGFVSVTKGISIHRTQCPNAQDMRTRFPYRVVNAVWSDNRALNEFQTSLRIVGQDDIGIVTNITSLISKEANVRLRNININTQDALFEGQLTLLIKDITSLDSLIKKIAAIRGVKTVTRM